MAGMLKKTTGLMGLWVCKSPHKRLKILYTKILYVLGQILKNAENELSLVRKMVEWKPWESSVEEPPANQWNIIK
uniref:NADH dehydrogenase [ubiquinone] 1 alpha subcomplex subunit 5 n=1 Tax=Monodon monoceros TaxID=40151 RepID=A0A8C6F0N8_MONMO